MSSATRGKILNTSVETWHKSDFQGKDEHTGEPRAFTWPYVIQLYTGGRKSRVWFLVWADSDGLCHPVTHSERSPFSCRAPQKSVFLFLVYQSCHFQSIAQNLILKGTNAVIQETRVHQVWQHTAESNLTKTPSCASQQDASVCRRGLRHRPATPKATLSVRVGKRQKHQHLTSREENG